MAAKEALKSRSIRYVLYQSQESSNRYSLLPTDHIATSDANKHKKVPRRTVLHHNTERMEMTPRRVL